MTSLFVRCFRTSVQQAEFTDVYNVEGGIHAYAEQVDPTVGFY